eukprot:gene13626-16040_t
MSDSIINELAQNWLRWDKNKETRKEIEQLVEQKNEKELYDCLAKRIAFGTAGLRGQMKAGFSNMNDLTVIQASQGLCKYVKETIPEAQKKGVVVGYDCRHHSETFARLTAATFASQGFTVYLYSKMVPTPFVAFGVTDLKACVGVMVTASHNPKEDNGYKVYWENGCQINSPHDKGISQQIELNLEPWTIDVNSLLEKVDDPLERVTKSYMDQISKYSVRGSVDMATENVVYTAMHGVGGVFVKDAFAAFGLAPYIPVPAQVGPDAEFPTVTLPNPEEGKGALKLSIETAEANNSRLIVANDPDADRLAAAEKLKDGSWKVFNGNEIGVLFADWAWQNARRQHGGDSINPSEYFMVTTAVSSSMLRTMATKEGYGYDETLTGFKWVGNKARDLIDQGKKFLFAYEESIGYMYGEVSLDKDGVRGAAVFTEMALSCYARGTSCQEHLESLYVKYGYHLSKNRYYFCYDPSKMVSIFNRIRNNGEFPKTCGPFEITRIRDLTVDYDNGYEDKKARLPVSSSTQMITFYFKNGAIATLRGSGTEPKLKYYVEMIGDDKEQVKATLDQVHDQVIQQFLRPTENQLSPPSDE